MSAALSVRAEVTKVFPPSERKGPPIEAFASLINRRLLLPSQKTNYIAVETHYLIAVLRHRVEEIYLDQDWYLDRYPDVRTAIRDGVVQNAKEHYALHGFYEHRLPYDIAVDENWYLAAYDDIRNAVIQGVFETGQMHFERMGYREGRHPYPAFCLRSAS